MNGIQGRRCCFLFRAFPRLWMATAFAIIAFVIILVSPARAWNDTGHMVVAEIARRHLARSAPDAQSVTALDKLAFLEALAALGAQPQNNTFVTSSCWADDLKDEGNRDYNALHYIDLPWSADGTPTSPPAAMNVVWAMEHTLSTLRSENAPSLERARALRFLIHFVGDAHQPLHCISLYSQKFPRGDRGGNEFKISGVYQTNLHWYWDTGGGAFGRTIPRPLTDEGRQTLAKLADECEAAFPFAQFKAEATPNLRAWAEESHNLAKAVVYSGIAESQTPSPEYSERAQLTAKRQAALAGYRLFMLLSTLS